MSTCKKARAENTFVGSSDKLSSLPPEIKGNILSRLNVKEAVRTSTLSSTWRDAWTNMPKIFLRDENFAQMKLVTLVDMVLSLHKGTIDQSDVSDNKSCHDEFDWWILMLSKRSPGSVIIKMSSRAGYRISSCLFSISDINFLHVENCIIGLPLFPRFKSLTRLSLNIFSSTDMDIQNLISLCPVLTDLRLIRFEGIHCLNIQALELEYLYVNGDFDNINLYAPNLRWAHFSLDHKAKACQSVPIAHDKESYVKQSLGSLRDIRVLAISGFFLKYLSKGCILTKLPVMFCLEDIYIPISFWDQRDVLTACSLFQNAPNLKNLEMWSFTWSMSGQDEDLVGIQNLTLQLQMDHLVTASVNHFRGLDCEVDFVAKLLSWAPALEELKIEWKGETECSMVLAKLLALPRVSPRAKVIVTF